MIPPWLTENLLSVAARLRPTGIDFAFLGGCVVPLLLDDPDLVPVRPTNDVDVIVLLVRQSQMASIEQKLRDQGFCHDDSPGVPLCRWKFQDVTVDIMPDKEGGFMGIDTRWFSEALESARPYPLPGGAIPIVSAPSFLATKLAAFADRGKGDYYHHDLEDVLTVIDGRASILEEVNASSHALRAYVKQEIGRHLEDSRFVDCIAGHLPGDPASQDRRHGLLERLRILASLS